ncbi:HNH endonuclease [Lusitaniella coriacea]|uniref:HNH endonuclease n=1 Tax=Lusitaniella coriacea TaxID=1983105 RepID=UPI003CEEA7B2
MNEVIKKYKLRKLYKSSDVSAVWNASQNLQVISHPQYGLISPNEYRAKYKNKPCPYCGKKMVQGQQFYSTTSRQDAINRGYQYVDKSGNKTINQAGKNFFHPNYITLDHRTNKARCPEKLFDSDNLEAICWRCNNQKGDDNSFELQHTCDYLNSLAEEARSRYPKL